MTQRPTLATRVRKATLERFVPIIGALSVAVALLSFLLINYQVTQSHQTRLEEFSNEYYRSIDALNEQVSALAQNDLIINSLIDFSNRDSYLPVFFRSLKPANHTSERSDFSIVFTDFEGEVITGSNLEAFPSSVNHEGWKDRIFSDSKPYLSISDNGLIIAHPVIYAGSAEGAIVLAIKELSSVLRVNAPDYNLLISKNAHVIFRTGTPSLTPVGTEHFDADTDISGLIANQIRIPLLKDGKSPKGHAAQEITLTMLEPFWSAYSHAGWIATLLILVLSVIMLSTLFSIRLTSTSASKIIHLLQSQIASSRTTDGKFLELAPTANESKEISDLRNTFNTVMQELLQTTDIKDRIEAVINSLSELLVVYDLKGREVLANNAFRALCEANGVDQADDSRTLFAADFVFPQSSTSPSIQKYKTQDDMDSRTVSWVRTVYRDQHNNPIGTLITGTDITLSQQLQQELSLKNRAVEDAETPIIIADAKIKGFPVIYTNKAFEEQTGYTLKEIQGQNCRFLQGNNTNPNDIAAISSALRNLRPITITILNYRKDGTEFYNRLALAPICDDEGNTTHFIGFQSDVTEQERAHQYLQQAKQKAEDSARLKSEFLASMSHEIRTPMNGILGMLGLLESTELSNEQFQHVRLAKSSADALLILINDILDFSKVEAGKLELEHVSFDMPNLISEVASSAAYVAEDKHLEIVLDVADAEHRQIFGDPGRIRQVLNNLIGNAIKFTNRGHIVISARSEQQPNEKCIYEVSIKDTGVGIPEEHIENIFDSFSQVDASTTRRYGGTGLGLTICKQLAQLMGGDIYVESAVGSGSTFTLRFESQQNDTEEDLFNTDALRTVKIAHLKGSEACLLSVEKQFKRWGIESYPFHSEEELLKSLETDHFDILLFSSSNLPHKDSVLCKKVREGSTNPNLSLCMLTTMSELKHPEQIAIVGVDAYFPKPVTQNELHDALVSLTIGDTKKYQSKHKSKRDHADYSGIKVLLVEDNPINQVLAVALLEQLGFTVAVANHGKEALKSLNEDSSFKLVFMDCQMPEMDGYEATHHIRAGKCGAGYTNIPIIAMTANAISGDREKCLDAGMSDYISKPIDTKLLAERIAHWCKGVKEQDVRTNNPKDQANAKVDESTQRTDEIDEDSALTLSEAPTDEPKEVPMNDIKVWDKDAALARTIGKEDLLRRVIDAYMAETPALVTKLSEAIKSEDLENSAYLAHTIKGASLNISADRLSELSATIEASSKAQDQAAVALLMDQLNEEAEALFAILNSFSAS